MSEAVIKKIQAKKRQGKKPTDKSLKSTGQAVSHGHKRDSKHCKKNSADSDSHSGSSDGDDEDPKDYRKGGYHPVHPNEVYKGRYKIIRKLGWGHFSTVWFAHDNQENRHVAIKFVKSETHYTEAALDEIKLLEAVRSSDPDSVGYDRIVSLLDHFEQKGPNGTHVCMVFEVLGHNLLKLIQDYEYRGIPIDIVKQIAKEVLEGLDCLHRGCAIIHTDLKPENVLLCIDHDVVEALAYKSTEKKSHPSASLSKKDHVVNYSTEHLGENLNEISLACQSSPTSSTESKKVGDLLSVSRYQSMSPEDIHVKIADLGNACWVDHHFTRDIQTRQYRSPEVILGGEYDSTVDIWSCACMIFELVTGDFLFQPKDSSRFGKNADHVAQIIELVGHFPKSLMRGRYADEIFNRRGEIRGIKELNIWSLDEVLKEKYHMDPLEAHLLSDFLMPMLEVDPRRRATAQECLRSPWLDLADDPEHFIDCAND